MFLTLKYGTVFYVAYSNECFYIVWDFVVKTCESNVKVEPTYLS